MNQPQSHRDTALNALTSRIIGCAIEVHRTLGPGLLEPLYETALCIELESAGIPHERQSPLPAYYKGRLLGEYRIDLVIADAVLVEVKRVERLTPVFQAQLLTYLRISRKRVGLLMNFDSAMLKDGITRMIL
jgi:GxxExxY protein